MHRIKGDRRQLHRIDLPLRQDGVIDENVHDLPHEVEIFAHLCHLGYFTLKSERVLRDDRRFHMLALHDMEAHMRDLPCGRLLTHATEIIRLCHRADSRHAHREGGI